MRKPIYVVVGMHRAGTSAVTKMLAALGVSLGDNLMPAVADNNQTGFFEDLDIVHLNDGILSNLGDSWDSVRLLEVEVLDPAKRAPLLEKGRELLEGKTASHAVFGFKDPRTARLLVFWRDVFEELGLEPRYIISSRHPMSVASSLLKRDGFSYEKSDLLWIEHMLSALHLTVGSKRLVIDYDRLLGNPRLQMERAQKVLELPRIDDLRATAAAYAQNFLSKDLRHWRYARDALDRNPLMPGMATELYNLLSRMAADEVSPDDTACIKAVRQMWRSVTGLSTVFTLAQEGISRGKEPKEADKTRQLEDHVAEQQDRIKMLETNLASHVERTAWLESAVNERDVRISQFESAISSRQQRIAWLESAVGKLESVAGTQADRIATLVSDVAARDSELQRISRELRGMRMQLSASEYDLGVAREGLKGANTALVETRKQVGELSAAFQDKVGELACVQASSLWRASAPFEKIWRRNYGFRFLHSGQLHALGRPQGWRSDGDDPQFELVPHKGRYPTGWIVVRSSIQSEISNFRVKLYLDAGKGYSEESVIRLPVNRSGAVLQIVRLPPGVRALRWDPVDAPGEFIQGPIVMTEVGLVERLLRMLVRICKVMREYSPAVLRQHGITWRRALFNLAGVYSAASELRGMLAVPNLEEERRWFLDAAYQVALGRAPDSAGSHHYSELIRAGVPMIHVMYRLLASPEAARNGRASAESAVLREAIERYRLP